MNAVKGRRVYPNKDGNLVLSSGDYGKNLVTGEWLARPPTCHAGGLKNHNVIEHEDGTITVSPSILITADGMNGSYHGFLKRGVWNEC